MRARVIAILAACSVCGSEALLARHGGALRSLDSAPRPIHDGRQALIDASASCVRRDALPRRPARDRLLTPQFCPDPALAGPGPEDL